MTKPLRRHQLAAAQETQRQRERAAGLARVTVLIPAARRAELHRIARTWRDEAELNRNVAEVDTGDQQ